MISGRKYLRCCLALLCLLQMCLTAWGQFPPPGSRIDTTVFFLNDKEIKMIRYQYGDPHIRFLVLHGTEKTGLKAAFEFMRLFGGSAIELNYGKGRYIEFSDSSKRFSFDPNNMFTDEGAYMGLVLFSEPQVHHGVPEKVRNLGRKILKASKPDSLGVIVTLHNNYNGGFSVYSYTPGNFLENSAEDVYINRDMDPDNFIFVTERRFFDYIKQKQVNVVLQSPQVPDDGSLSVFAMQNQIPYANIESQHGHLAENFRLIVLVVTMLKDLHVDLSSSMK